MHVCPCTYAWMHVESPSSAHLYVCIMYVCMHAWLCVCAHAHMHGCIWRPVDHGYYSSMQSTFFFYLLWEMIFQCPIIQHVVCRLSQWSSLVLVSPSLGLWACNTMLSFFAWILGIGPQVCKAALIGLSPHFNNLCHWWCSSSPH